MIFYIAKYDNYNNIFNPNNFDIKAEWYFCAVRFGIENFGFLETEFTTIIRDALLSNSLVYDKEKNEFIQFDNSIRGNISPIIFHNSKYVNSQIDIENKNKVIIQKNLLYLRYNKPLLEMKHSIIAELKEQKQFDSIEIKKMIDANIVKAIYWYSSYGDIILFNKNSSYYDKVIKILEANRLEYIVCQSLDEIPI